MEMVRSRKRIWVFILGSLLMWAFLASSVWAAEADVVKLIDRAYHDVRRPQYLKAGNLSLGIQAQGFPDVVVWNPWVERCAELKDMPADGWRHMLCVEAAATRPVSLPAGEEWYGRQTLVVV